MRGVGAARVAATCAMIWVASALRNMELVTDAGEEVIGRQAANCLACLAVMESLELAMCAPFEKVDIGRDDEVERRRRRMLNKQLYVQQVIDPTRCKSSMDEYDLSYAGGKNTLLRQAKQRGLPIHMELNDWAKEELTQYCESVIEEYEEVLASLSRSTQVATRERAWSALGA